MSVGRIALTQNNYGKSGVRLMKVSRDGSRHDIAELCVQISLEGDFAAIHTEGDNAKCLPTDTMKNTVYALAKQHPVEPIESFAAVLCRHFISKNPQVSQVTVEIARISWDRVSVASQPHPHCFTKGSAEQQVCRVRQSRDSTHTESGIDDLIILKSTDSAFTGYLKDELTTLPEAPDRIFATSMTAWWTCAQTAPAAEAQARRALIRTALIDTFAGHKSQSVQHTLHAMGQAALQACESALRIRLSMPNKHCLLANLKPFGLDNPNEIFMPTDEPFGVIEATLERMPPPSPGPS